jgi:hypothetical protein
MFSFYIHNLIEAKGWHSYKHKVGFRADLSGISGDKENIKEGMLKCSGKFLSPEAQVSLDPTLRMSCCHTATMCACWTI